MTKALRRQSGSSEDPAWKRRQTSWKNFEANAANWARGVANRNEHHPEDRIVSHADDSVFGEAFDIPRLVGEVFQSFDRALRACPGVLAFMHLFRSHKNAGQELFWHRARRRTMV